MDGSSLPDEPMLEKSTLTRRDNSEPLPSNLQQQADALAKMADDDIDYSDIPEVVDWAGFERGRFVKPLKRLMSVRLDVEVIEWFKSSGPGYQTRMNDVLRDYMIAQLREERRKRTPPTPTR